MIRGRMTSLHRFLISATLTLGLTLPAVPAFAQSPGTTVVSGDGWTMAIPSAWQYTPGNLIGGAMPGTGVDTVISIFRHAATDIPLADAAGIFTQGLSGSGFTVSGGSPGSPVHGQPSISVGVSRAGYLGAADIWLEQGQAWMFLGLVQASDPSQITQPIIDLMNATEGSLTPAQASSS